MLSGVETFVIRDWMPTGDECDRDAARLRGLVEHVRLGDRAPFENGDQLLAFLHGVCTPESQRAAAKGERP